jgi:hypothetical protein
VGRRDDHGRRRGGDFLLVPSAGDNAPTASAVTINDDGTVTIELTDVKEIPAANNTLAEAGIRAELVPLYPENSGSCVDSTVHIGEDIHVVPVPGN